MSRLSNPAVQADCHIPKEKYYMKKTRMSLAANLAVTFAIVALAQAAPAFAGVNNQVDITQAGNDNSAISTQAGTLNTGTITQHQTGGVENTVTLNQAGTSNTSTITQVGTGNTAATTIIDGSVANVTTISQGLNTNSTNYATQQIDGGITGAGNTVVATQDGAGANTSLQTVSGNGNYVS